MSMIMKQHIDMLGKKAQDVVTGFTGVVSSVSFDLYGCVQAVLTPAAGKDGELGQGAWFDITRIKVLGNKPVMELPDYEQGYVADGKKGPAEKPTMNRVPD